MHTYNNTCPSCGRDKLSITILEDGTKLWNCFRSSCSYRGRASPDGVAYPVTRITYRRGNPFLGELLPLPAKHREMLATEFGFANDHLARARPMWSAAHQRIAFPLLDPLGRRQGWCLRSYTGAEPKALTYVDDESSRLSYYARGSDTALLVEDIPSAVRASPYLDSIAILGTSITEDDRLEISTHYDRIIIALDADATRQAILLQKENKLLFDNIDVMVLPCDIKDMPEEDVYELLGGLLSEP